jgi:hypothetical protein
MAERLATVLFVVLVLLALPQPALAAPPIAVGNGTPASCTEMALKDALIVAETVGGATIRFKCGPDPVTIALSQVTTSLGFRSCRCSRTIRIWFALPGSSRLESSAIRRAFGSICRSNSSRSAAISDVMQVTP